MSFARRAAALYLLAAALPALAYVLPGRSVIRRLSQKREDQALHAFQVKGTLTFSGEAAKQASAATGVAVTGDQIAAPGLFTVKTPGRCRLDMSLSGVTEAEMPMAVSKYGKASGHKLDQIPAALAATVFACAVLGERGGEIDKTYLPTLSRLGIPAEPSGLARFLGRIAYVIGAAPTEKERPQLWVEKATFQPSRVIAKLGGTVFDVRFVDFGSTLGGDFFPRALEVWAGGELQLRLATEQVIPNPKIADGLF